MRRRPPDHLPEGQVRRRGPFRGLLLSSQHLPPRRICDGRHQSRLQQERGEVAGATALAIGAVSQLGIDQERNGDRDTGREWKRLNRGGHGFAVKDPLSIVVVIRVVVMGESVG